MKTLVKINTSLLVWFFMLTLIFADNLAGQTNIGILPVSNSAVGSPLLSVQKWQLVSPQIQEQIAQQLEDMANVHILSREHILLLLKEVPSPDPENLSVESLKAICKKKNLNYLVKCTFHAVKTADKNLILDLHFEIMESEGKVFWQKVKKINKDMPEAKMTQDNLWSEIINQAKTDVFEEIKRLNY
jgi:hypothetical protein